VSDQSALGRPSGASNRPLVVEFVGLPGGGKTTVARLVQQELAARGHICGGRHLIGRRESSQAAHYAALGRFYLSHSGELGSLVRLCLSGSRPSLARVRQALKLSVWSYRLRQVGTRGYQVTILDQGPVQQACSTMLHGRVESERAIAAALSGLLRGTKIRLALIYFDLDVDLAIQRIAGRPGGGRSFGRLKGDQGKSLLTAYRRQLERLFDRAAEAAGAAQCRVDGARPPREICSHIVGHIETLLSPPLMGALQ
jgi:thymidylate kinase